MRSPRPPRPGDPHGAPGSAVHRIRCREYPRVATRLARHRHDRHRLHADGGLRRRRFPATDVTATVGGELLTMTRVAGTPESGTWSTSGTLPAGTWAPRVHRHRRPREPRDRRRQPRSPSTGRHRLRPRRSRRSSPLPSRRQFDRRGRRAGRFRWIRHARCRRRLPDGDLHPMAATRRRNPAAPPPPRPPNPDPSADTAGPHSSGAGGPAHSDPAERAERRWTRHSRAGGGTRSSPRASATTPMGPVVGAVARPVGPRIPTNRPMPAPSRGPDGDGELRSEDGLLRTVLLVGLAGVTAVALAGTMLLVIGRRRSGDANATVRSWCGGRRHRGPARAPHRRSGARPPRTTIRSWPRSASTRRKCVEPDAPVGRRQPRTRAGDR